MMVWILILTHTVALAGVDIIASYNPFLFESQAACEASRPALEAKANAFAPQGYLTPVTSKVGNCMELRVMSAEDFEEVLRSLP